MMATSQMNYGPVKTRKAKDSDSLGQRLLSQRGSQYRQFDEAAIESRISRA